MPPVAGSALRTGSSAGSVSCFSKLIAGLLELGEANQETTARKRMSAW